MIKNNPAHFGRLVLTLILISLAAPNPAFAHGGEEHGEPAPEKQPAKSGVTSISGFGDTFELTIAYGPFDPGQMVELRLFLALLDTNRPVPDAELSLTLTGPDTEKSLVATPVSDSPGQYSMSVTIPDDGDYSFLVEATSGDLFDLFSVDGFSTVEHDEAAAPVIRESFWQEYSIFCALGGGVIIAVVSYSIGARDRKRKHIRSEQPLEEGKSV